MRNIDKQFTQILKEELLPAMGCTEPIAIAYAAAKAKEILNEPVEHVMIHCSSNIIKNVRCVRVPNTDGLIGVEVAALAGIVAGDSTRCLEVISEVTEAQREKIRHLLKEKICEVKHLDTTLTLHLIVEVKGNKSTAAVEITHTHTHIASMTRNGQMLDCEKLCAQCTRTDRSCLNIEAILEYAQRVDLETVRPIIQRQIDCNMAISKAGKSGAYGINIAKIILEENNDSLSSKMAAATAAASEARMDGCSLPVVTNSGSGNQGITASVPVLVFCQENKISEETMIRALLVSNLLTIHQKTSIGHLSAFCGAVSASSAVAGTITWLKGGTLCQVGEAIKNTLSNLSGMICDGAKITCAFKIASGIHAAMLASTMAMQQCSYQGEIGILKEDVEETIASVGKLACQGMRQTDQVILDLMLKNNH